jgi:hypothetical protein
MADISGLKINSAGAREILNSPQVQKELLRRANLIKANADSVGSGKYTADVQPGKNRAHALVKTTDAVSCASNAKHNTLLKSLDAGRG